MLLLLLARSPACCAASHASHVRYKRYIRHSYTRYLTSSPLSSLSTPPLSSLSPPSTLLPLPHPARLKPRLLLEGQPAGRQTLTNPRPTAASAALEATERGLPAAALPRIARRRSRRAVRVGVKHQESARVVLLYIMNMRACVCVLCIYIIHNMYIYVCMCVCVCVCVCVCMYVCVYRYIYRL